MQKQYSKTPIHENYKILVAPRQLQEGIINKAWFDTSEKNQNTNQNISSFRWLRSGRFLSKEQCFDPFSRRFPHG